MARNIGLVITEHITMGVVEDDRVVGEVARYPEGPDAPDQIRAMPAEELVRVQADEIKALAEGEPMEAIGLAYPGIVRCGVIEDSPNLHQLKGFPMETAMRTALAERGDALENRGFKRRRRGGVGNRGGARKAGSSSFGCGRSATGSGSGGIRRRTGFGKAGTSSCRSIPMSVSAAAAGSGTWKASWAIARCGCGFSTWNRKKCSRRPKPAKIRAAPSSRFCGIVRWRRPRRRASI